MESPDLPEVRFDEDQGEPIYPRPVLKNAVLVKIPYAQGGAELPTFIQPEWKDGVQVFYGDYYAIVNHEGTVAYGSAKDQWRNMHQQVRPGYWVKTAIPAAYQATEPCRVVTIIPSEDGGIHEANHVLEVGDWVVRQPGGEVQHVKARNFDGIYFSSEEAAELGLDKMSAEQFAEWAIAQVRSTTAA